MRLFVAFLFLIPTLATAEYRVFQYYIKSKLNMFEKNQAYLVTSAMNPKTYLAYHGGSNSISIDLVRSWVCKGHTGNGKATCDAPLNELATPGESP